jgi:hypothetical protein
VSETTVPQRRWFQFHLSTALVMMVVAGGFVRLNTISIYGFVQPKGSVFKYPDPTDEPHWTHTFYSPYRDWFEKRIAMDFTGQGGDHYGWPFIAYGDLPVATPRFHMEEHAFDYKCVLADLSIAVFALAMVALLCEFFIRRREARKL